MGRSARDAPVGRTTWRYRALEATKRQVTRLEDGESVCKRDSVGASRHRMTIHLCGLPEGCPSTGRTGRPHPLLGLAPNGGTEPPGSPRRLVRSYRTVSPLPVTSEVVHRRCAFCCSRRQVTPTWLSPAFCPVESRLSSTDVVADIAPRSSDRLAVAEQCRAPGRGSTPCPTTDGSSPIPEDGVAQQAPR